MKNRNPIKQLFITFPQTEETREQFLENCPPSTYSLVCQEEHSLNGGFHLHCVLKLKKGLSFSKLVKWFKEKYPDDWKRIKIECVRSLDNSIDYCKKEDPNCLTTGKLDVRKRKPVWTIFDMNEQKFNECIREVKEMRERDIRIERERYENSDEYELVKRLKESFKF